jgi:hypothetical protein
VWYPGSISVVNAIIEDEIDKTYLQLADADPKIADSDPAG